MEMPSLPCLEKWQISTGHVNSNLLKIAVFQSCVLDTIFKEKDIGNNITKVNFTFRMYTKRALFFQN